MSKNDEKIKVVLIDPWGIANTSEYLNGLIFGLSKFVDLKVFTNAYFMKKTDSKADIHRVFFKRSEQMKPSKYRKILRGFEYILGYLKILFYLRQMESADVIHINWLLNYKLDVFFLKCLKRHTKQLVYTAHNVLPHINGENSIDVLRTIYSLCNRIVLHGNCIKEEFEVYFPNQVKKIYIQKHGGNIKPNIAFNTSEVSTDIVQKVNAFEKRFIFFGRVFRNKGADRIISSWDSSWDDTLLIIAGHWDGEYSEMDECLKKIEASKNILLLNEYVNDNTLNYLITNSQLIVLPYRHASMSGVVFTAADFNKTVLCTNVGALPEYLVNNEDSFIVDNDDLAIAEKLKFIHSQVTKSELTDMGVNLHDNILKKCSWEVVANKLVEECYLK